MSSGWKADLFNQLFEILDEKGLSEFLFTAYKLLQPTIKVNDGMKPELYGALCEAVLCGLTSEYIKDNKVKAKVFSSVILEDLDNPKSAFRTELDFVLVTPGFVVSTECKSYSGDVLITDECTLRRGSLVFDVYKQVTLHHKVLEPYVARRLVRGAQAQPSIVMSNVFLFARANVIERRARPKVLVHTLASLYDYYDKLFERYSVPVLDYKKICADFKKRISPKAREEHAAYLGYGG